MRAIEVATAEQERQRSICGLSNLPSTDLERYKAGLVGYLDVVYARESVLTNEQTSAQIGGQRLVASVVLIKALGGGWAGGNAP
jgi:hypothetical protein